MKQKTSEKALQAAIHLFNKKGYAAVTMFEIAKSIKISRSNLAYHFANKEALLKAIVKKMWLEFETQWQKSLTFPSFQNLSEAFREMQQIQKQYYFIFMDSHVLQHPLLKMRFRQFMTRFINDIKKVIAFSIQTGNMKPEEIPGTYHQMAFTTWMVSFFWLSQKVIRGADAQKQSADALWALILPHLTDKGKKSLLKFMGKDSFQKFGEPFEKSMEKLLTI